MDRHYASQNVVFSLRVMPFPHLGPARLSLFMRTDNGVRTGDSGKVSGSTRRDDR